jgi:hypothetical protein
MAYIFIKSVRHITTSIIRTPIPTIVFQSNYSFPPKRRGMKRNPTQSSFVGTALHKPQPEMQSKNHCSARILLWLFCKKCVTRRSCSSVHLRECFSFGSTRLLSAKFHVWSLHENSTGQYWFWFTYAKCKVLYFCHRALCFRTQTLLSL